MLAGAEGVALLVEALGPILTTAYARHGAARLESHSALGERRQEDQKFKVSYVVS